MRTLLAALATTLALAVLFAAVAIGGRRRAGGPLLDRPEQEVT
jgi:hypothetical protein